MKVSHVVLRFTFLVMGCCFSVNTSQAQDFVSMYKKFLTRLKEDPLKVSGGISVNTDFLASSDSLRNQSPFNYRLSANLNFDLMGVRIPLSVNYSNAKTVYNYKLPSYRFIGLSPTYKWATLHLGDRSMEFSPYTLSGQTFYGIGTELKPGKFRFAAMYGRLRKPIQESITDDSSSGPEPAFKRMGWGVKTGYDIGKTGVDIIVFHAKDDPNSIDSLTQHPTLKPMENLVLGFNGKRQLGKIMTLSVEYAMSAMTHNVLEQELVGEDSKISKTLNNAFDFNLSTQYYNALKSSLGFNFKKGMTVQLNYERVDPGYRSLGTMYFNDNMENYTVSTTNSLFKKKLNLSSNVGIQRTNLDNSQLSSSLRLVGALNASFKASERLNFSSAYSNFRNTNVREVTIESLQTASTNISQYNSISFITQVSQNANLTSSYLAGKNKTSTIAALISYQESNAIENGIPLLDQQSKYYIASLTYSYTLKDKNMTLSTSMMANYGELPLADLFSLAPTVAVSKSLLEKTLQVTSTFSYSNVHTGGLLVNRLFSGQMGLQYTKFKEHPIGLNLRYVHRGTVPGNEAAKALSEFSGSVTYSYRFAPKLWKGKKEKEGKEKKGR